MANVEEFSDTERLRVVVLRDGTEATVIVVGHFDVRSSGLRDRAEELLATRPRSIAIDASGLTFVDSWGLAELLRARHAVTTEAGRSFRIIHPSTALRHAAELAGFQALLLED
jgi:anti-anti-sigma factor